MIMLLLFLSATLPAQDSTVYTAVAAGSFFTCALSREGAAYCWGFGHYGQLGNGDTASSQVPRPVRLPDSTRFTSLALGQYHACALGADSLAFCWGGNWGVPHATHREPMRPYFHFSARSIGGAAGRSGSGRWADRSSSPKRRRKPRNCANGRGLGSRSCVPARDCRRSSSRSIWA